jgi:hypothetical protein
MLMFKLIKLPFKLLRLLIWKPIWHFVYFFLCRPMLAITVLSLGGMYLAYTGYNVFDRWSHAIPPKVEKADGKAIKSYRVSGMPQIRGTIQDGNSRFVDDVVAKLNAQENHLYYNEFYTAILNNRDDEPYFWQVSDQLFGKVIPQKAFLNPRGEYCRPFHEVISVHSVAQESDEVMCQNETKTGWCRLNTSSTPSCSITFSSGWDRGVRKITNIGDWF